MNNALFVDAIENEDEVVALAIKNLRLLIKDSELLQKLSRNSYDYAKKYFTKDLFLRKYRELLLSHNEKRSAK
jgi:hypothetical protein